MAKLNKSSETYDMYSIEHHAHKRFQQNLWWQVLRFPYTEQMFTAFSLALIVGYVLQTFPQVVTTYFMPLHDLFHLLLKVMVVPLMVMSIVSTILSVRLKARIGKLVSASFAYFLLTSVAATSVSLVLAVMMEEVYPFFEEVKQVPVAVSGGAMMGRIGDAFLRNLFSAISSGSVLFFLCLSFLLGFVLLPAFAKRQALDKLQQRVDTIIHRMLYLLWRIGPFAMFFMFTPTVATYGQQLVGTYASFIGACYMCYVMHGILVFLPSVYFWGGINPLRFIYGMARPLMFAMASQASILTIPYGIRATDKMGVRKEVNRLLLPLGSTFNMDGSAIYMVVSSVFVASCFGIDLTMGQYISIGITATLLSFCVVGGPGGSLAMLPLVFLAAGIPLEGVALVAVVDRVVDMGRTTVSVTGDSVAALVLDKWLLDKKAKRPLDKKSKVAA